MLGVAAAFAGNYNTCLILLLKLPLSVLQRVLTTPVCTIGATESIGTAAIDFLYFHYYT